MKDYIRDFDHHPPEDDVDIGAHETVRQSVRDLARTIETLVPANRELSIVYTKLEEVMFWANAGLARARYDAKQK